MPARDSANVRHAALSPAFQLRAIAVISALAMLSIIVFRGSLLEAAEARLATHMIIEHVVFFLMGALSVMAGEIFLKLLVRAERGRGPSRASRAWRGALKSVFASVHGLLWLALAAGLMAFWHVPEIFDLASTNASVHVLQHVSFAAVGAAGFIATRTLGDSFRILLIVAMVGMMGFAGLLFSVLDRPVYTAYSTAGHNEAGTYMIVTSMLLLLVGLPLFLVKRTLSYIKAVGGE